MKTYLWWATKIRLVSFIIKQTLEWQRQWEAIANDLSTVDGRLRLSRPIIRSSVIRGHLEYLGPRWYFSRSQCSVRRAPSATLRANIKRPLFHNGVNFSLWQPQVTEPTGNRQQKIYSWDMKAKWRHPQDGKDLCFSARNCGPRSTSRVWLENQKLILLRVRDRGICIHHHKKVIQIPSEFPPLAKMCGRPRFTAASSVSEKVGTLL